MSLIKKSLLTTILVLILLCGSNVFGQDITRLLEAVDQIETNLKALIEKEAAARNADITRLETKLEEKSHSSAPVDNQAFANLEKKINKLQQMLASAPTGNTGLSDSEAATLVSDIEFLKSEITYMKNLVTKNSQQLASNQSTVAVRSNNDEIAILTSNLATVAESLSELAQYQGVSESSAPEITQGDGRTKLEDNGVTFELAYTGELMSNVSGGLAQRSEYLENGDILLSIDAEKLMSWNGASFSLYALGDRGGSISENVGDAQGVSNIDSDDTWKLYEAWYQQNLFNDRLSLLAGLYDLNSEFDAIETAGLFLNSSFGIGPDYSQSGQNGPSIFPTTSMALRVSFQPSDAFYIQSAIFDGVPGDPEKPSGTHIKFNKGDGSLIATEVGYLTGTDEDSEAAYSKYALGTWVYSAKFDDIAEVDGSGDPIRRSGNSGIYFLGEQTVYRKDDPSQNLALFARIGFANTKINQIGSYFGGGIVASGLIPGRNEDQIGLAVAMAINGSKFKQAQIDAGTPVDGKEITLELSYRSQILPQLAIHPDLQYVINPGMDPNVKNALVFGTRFELSF